MKFESFPGQEDVQSSGLSPENISRVTRSEIPEQKARELLERIEAERFKSLDDPGIHGIKERIGRLGFVNIDAEECCSGHPQDDEDLRLEHKGLHEGQETGWPRGYTSLRYRIDDPRSAEFHNKLRKVDVLSFGFQARHDSHGVRSESAEKDELAGNSNWLEEARVVSSAGVPPASFDFFKRRASEAGIDRDWLSIPYELRVVPWGSDPKKHTAQEAAEALRRFWENVSLIIQRYEEVPIKEKLEPWYFSVRSRYGKIELTYKAFKDRIPEIEKRSGVKV